MTSSSINEARSRLPDNTANTSPTTMTDSSSAVAKVPPVDLYDFHYEYASDKYGETLVLETSRGKCFRVHPVVMSMTSEFFNDMLSIPQPEESSQTDESGKEDKSMRRDYVKLEESEDVVKSMLDIITPGHRSGSLGLKSRSASRFELLRDLTRASDKYGMPDVLSFVQDVLESPEVVEASPVEAFALACINGWDSLAVKISRSTLDEDLYSAENSKFLRQVPSPWSMRLMDLHHKRKEAVQRAFRLNTNCSNYSKKMVNLREITIRPHEPCGWKCRFDVDDRSWSSAMYSVLDEMSKGTGGSKLCSKEFWERNKIKVECSNCGKDFFNPSGMASEMQDIIDRLPQTI